MNLRGGASEVTRSRRTHVVPMAAERKSKGLLVPGALPLIETFGVKSVV